MGLTRWLRAVLGYGDLNVVDNVVKKLYCGNCKYYYNPSPVTWIVPCKDHPYYFHNWNYDCKYYKRIWWKFWV
jgi:hypothetical protein